mmetsp:Transcript_22240/g.44135  ORF Transcript_22240/g.44135 Transcript_22240/m.44135 type:complete len:266 (-) Transcript_22240:101-898(-)
MQDQKEGDFKERSTPENDIESTSEVLQSERYLPRYSDGVHVFMAEWDEEGVFVYQAYNDDIADWAVEHQKFGGPVFKPFRMTWFKPSFAWVLYRSGYASKHNQTRILKIKLPHAAIAALLTQCKCRHGGGGSFGRVQWDPARDLLSSQDDKGKEPRKLLRLRAIQIGVKGKLSEQYVNSVVQIQDVTALATLVGSAHQVKSKADRKAAIEHILPQLPEERPYLPPCTHEVLRVLRMMPSTDFEPEEPQGPEDQHRSLISCESKAV